MAHRSGHRFCHLQWRTVILCYAVSAIVCSSITTRRSKTWSITLWSWSCKGTPGGSISILSSPFSMADSYRPSMLIYQAGKNCQYRELSSVLPLPAVNWSNVFDIPAAWISIPTFLWSWDTIITDSSPQRRPGFAALFPDLFSMISVLPDNFCIIRAEDCRKKNWYWASLITRAMEDQVEFHPSQSWQTEWPDYANHPEQRRGNYVREYIWEQQFFLPVMFFFRTTTGTSVSSDLTGTYENGMTC